MRFGAYNGGPLRPYRPASPILIFGGVCCLFGLVFFLLLVAFYGDPDERDVTAAGVVVNERGLPVTGASVTLLPTAQSDFSASPVVTTTDATGFFRAHLIYSATGLIADFVLEVKNPGFKVARVNVGTGASGLQINLEADVGRTLKF